MIVSCITMALVADLRFNILNKYITEFIVVESKFTHMVKKSVVI